MTGGISKQEFEKDVTCPTRKAENHKHKEMFLLFLVNNKQANKRTFETLKSELLLS